MNTGIKILPFAFVGMLLIAPAWGAEKTDIYKAAVDSNGVQKIDMVGGSYYFKPNYIIVKVNTPVEITIRREPGIASHSIVLNAPEAGIDFEVELSADTKTIKFTPTKVGKYPFYCDEGLIEKHRAKGMEGTLEVTE